LGFQPKPDKRSALDCFFCKRVRACLQSFGQTFLKVREIAVYRNGFGATPQGFNVFRRKAKNKELLLKSNSLHIN